MPYRRDPFLFIFPMGLIPLSSENRTENTSTRLIKESDPPWNLLTIDLDALVSNYRSLRARIPEQAVFYAVLKSDAYGHGIMEVGKALQKAGCSHFAVESTQEGIALRGAGIKGEILVMNPIPLWMAELSVKYDLSVSVIHESILDPLQEACDRLGKTCRLHLNVNVGLNRLGIAPSRLMKIAAGALERKSLVLEGLFGQPRDPISARGAFEKLKSLYGKMRAAGVSPKFLHFANSTTFLAHPDTTAGGVRIGILLYGALPPEQKDADVDIDLAPLMSLTSEIVQIRNTPAGSRVGYRSRDITDEDKVIATIPIGYFHGLDRSLSGKGRVLVAGRTAPFIGAVSMNASTIDITGIPGVSIGGKVTIVGRDGEEEITMQDLAVSSGTIAAELMIRLGQGGIARHYEIERDGFGEEQGSEASLVPEMRIEYFQTERDLPDWLGSRDIVDFLEENMEEYGDSRTTIGAAIDYALSSNPRGGGFVMLALDDHRILGAVVNTRTHTTGFIPENIFVYVCVHRDFRRRGIARVLMRRSCEAAGGQIKIHVEKGNAAAGLYERLGFSNDYLEMRYKEGEQD